MWHTPGFNSAFTLCNDLPNCTDKLSVPNFADDTNIFFFFFTGGAALRVLASHECGPGWIPDSASYVG